MDEIVEIIFLKLKNVILINYKCLFVISEDILIINLKNVLIIIILYLNLNFLKLNH